MPCDQRNLASAAALFWLLALAPSCSSPEPEPDGGDADTASDGDADADVESDGDGDADADGDAVADVEDDVELGPIPDADHDPESPPPIEPEVELSYWLVHEYTHCDGIGCPGGATVDVSSPNPGDVVAVFRCISAGVVGTCAGHRPEVELDGWTLDLTFIGSTGSTCGCGAHDFTVVIAGLPPGTYTVAGGGLTEIVTVE